jgi:small subunit ribosomal protein S9
MKVINTIGRRKSSVARIYMSEGNGNIVVNNKPLNTYFPTQEFQNLAKLPLSVCDADDKFDINVNVMGGGVSGQADAIKLAIARALVELDNDTNRPLLKPKSLLTRDPRSVERKKYGQPKARKKRQFSKR